LVGLVVVGTLWIGFDVIAARYKELVGEDAIVREGRVVVYRDTIRMIMANPGGLGPGEYQDRFREFQTFRPELLFDHAHNDYLESMAEWGIVVALIFWALILSVLIAAIRTFFGPTSPERRGILLACIGAIFSILLHSLTDFNLQIPSNAMLFFTFVGIAFAQSLGQSRKDSGEDSGLA
jgi:O-antigen ligase